MICTVGGLQAVVGFCIIMRRSEYQESILKYGLLARNHGRLLAPVNAYHAQRGGRSYDQRWNNTAALTTLRTGKGVRYLWRYGKVYSHLALVDIKPRELMPSAMVDHQRLAMLINYFAFTKPALEAG